MVVLGWGLGNGLLIALLGGLGGDEIQLLLYAGSAMIVGLFAVAIWASSLHHPSPLQHYWISQRGGASIGFAFSCFFLALAGVFGYWFIPVAVPPLVLTVILLLASSERTVAAGIPPPEKTEPSETAPPA